MPPKSRADDAVRLSAIGISGRRRIPRCTGLDSREVWLGALVEDDLL